MRPMGARDPFLAPVCTPESKRGTEAYFPKRDNQWYDVNMFECEHSSQDRIETSPSTKLC
jgi:hypothetical protein